MLDLEVIRLELNNLKQELREVTGYKAADEIEKAVQNLVLCYLIPTSYSSLSQSNINVIEQHFYQLEVNMDSNEFKLISNNITTIKSLIKQVKFECYTQ